MGRHPRDFFEGVEEGGWTQARQYLTNELTGLASDCVHELRGKGSLSQEHWNRLCVPFSEAAMNLPSRRALRGNLLARRRGATLRQIAGTWCVATWRRGRPYRAHFILLVRCDFILFMRLHFIGQHLRFS